MSHPPMPSPHHLHGHLPKSSIDLSMELERELNADGASSSIPSLDPGVLTSLIVQLRGTVAELSQTREDLVTTLAHANSQVAELKDSLSLADEKAVVMLRENEELKEKGRSDQDTIALLRQKVEESRRGLMRLQTENRRSNLLPPNLDLSKPGSTPIAVKRASYTPGSIASFTPIAGSGFPSVGRGHRRVSSVSEQGSDIQSPPQDPPLTPNADGLPAAPTPTVEVGNPSRTANILSGLFRLSSSPQDHASVLTSADPEVVIADAQGEIQRLRRDLRISEGRVIETKEALEASESCIKVLRDFISENRVGESGQASIPPLPAEAAPKKAGTAWGGLRLWRTETTSDNGSAAPSQSSPPASPDSSNPPIPQLPLSRKLGGFFTRKTSSNPSVPVVQTHDSENANAVAASENHPTLPCNDGDSLNHPQEETVSDTRAGIEPQHHDVVLPEH